MMDSTQAECSHVVTQISSQHVISISYALLQSKMMTLADLMEATEVVYEFT